MQASLPSLTAIQRHTWLTGKHSAKTLVANSFYGNFYTNFKVRKFPINTPCMPQPVAAGLICSLQKAFA